MSYNNITNSFSFSCPQNRHLLYVVHLFERKIVCRDVGVKSLHRRPRVTEEAHVDWLNLARQDPSNTTSQLKCENTEMQNNRTRLPAHEATLLSIAP